jgi:2'-phosphotransferase
MAAGRGGGRGGSRSGSLPRPVQISKKLSWLLRHGAEEEGLQLGEGGYANLQEVLNNRKIRGLKPTFEEVKQIVQENDKQRFTLKPVTENEDDETSGSLSDKPKDWLIRANQGHSLKVESEGLLKPITEENKPETAVHGTTHAAWPLIVPSGGLKPMGRNHVHFASGLPAGFKSIVETDTSSDTAAAPVISGMRKSSTLLMFLDVDKALAAGLKLWVSDNGVILSEGNSDGLVPLELFKRVEDRTGEGVLLEDGKVVKEAPESWAAKAAGKGKGKG